MLVQNTSLSCQGQRPGAALLKSVVEAMIPPEASWVLLHMLEYELMCSPGEVYGVFFPIFPLPRLY